MSNNQAYVRSLFDDARFQLEGAVQSGAKWPPALAIKPQVEEYKGYTNSFVRFVVRTNIEGDRNNGIIELKVPVQTWQAIGFLIAGLTGEDTKLDPIDCYERPFGRDKKPVKENTLMGRIHLTVREGRISIAVIDARNEGRVKIPFYFGTPNTRCPMTTQGAKDNFALNKAYAQAWFTGLNNLMPDAFKEAHTRALKRSTTMQRDEESSGSSSSRNDDNHAPADLDDDLPF